MNQRKLNRRQQWRAEKIQQERSARAAKQERDLDQQLESSELGDEQLGLVVSRYSKEFEVEALEGRNAGQLHRCLARTNLGSIVAGDRVIWRPALASSGIIVSREPRVSVLERPDNFGRLKAVAANIDQMIVVIAATPSPQANLIDRYLVAAELLNIRPVLVLNKADLIDTNNKPMLTSLLERYANLGYCTAKVISAKNETTDLEALKSLIADRTSIIVGQSGVGKSSLINGLLPDAQLAVGELSHASGEGTHTTTRAAAFHLVNGGMLIDSPGIRDFSLWHIGIGDLQKGFVEIADFATQCKFRNCQHDAEPGCAVLSAVSKGQIDSARFASYKTTKLAIDEQQARGLGTTY